MSQETRHQMAETPPKATAEVEKIIVEVPHPMDGGTVAWLTILGAWMIVCCSFGYLNAFGVFQDYYSREFLTNKSASDISWIGSFQLFMQYALGALVGKAFDDGYFHHLAIFGSIFYVFSLFMLSLTRPGHYYEIFLSQGIGMGIGQGLLYIPALLVVGHHFRRRRALAIGIVTTGASVGGIFFPIMLNNLIIRVGFSNAVRATAGLIAVLLATANCLVKTRYSQEKGLSSSRPTISAILADSPYTSSIFAAFITNLGLFFPYFYLQYYAIEQGVASKKDFYVLAILNAGSVPGRLLPSFLADRLGVYNMLVPCLLLSAVLLLAILGIHTFGGIISVGLLFGFSSGSYVSLVPSLIAQLTSNRQELGLRTGLAFSVVSVSMLVGTPIEGALLGGTPFDWWKTIAFCGICVALGTCFMFVSRYLFVKNRGKGALANCRVALFILAFLGVFCPCYDMVAVYE